MKMEKRPTGQTVHVDRPDGDSTELLYLPTSQSRHWVMRVWFANLPDKQLKHDRAAV